MFLSPLYSFVLSHPPISLAAAVMTTVTVIAAAQVPPAVTGPYTGDLCEGFNGVEGACATVNNCPALEQEFYLVPLPELIARHGPSCDYDLRDSKLLCCPAEEPVKTVPELIVNNNDTNTPKPDQHQQNNAGEPLKTSPELIVRIPDTNTPKPDQHQQNNVGCEIDGHLYPNGNVYNGTSDCYSLQCLNGKVSPILRHTIGNRCMQPFEEYGGACYQFRNTWVTWCEARQFCHSHGAELPIDNFDILKAYYTLKKRSSYYSWVGMKNNMWLNGRVPKQQQWSRNQPGTKDQCGVISLNGLWDKPCNTTDTFMCQLY